MLLYGVNNGDYLVYTEEDKSFLQGFENVFCETFTKNCESLLKNRKFRDVMYPVLLFLFRRKLWLYPTLNFGRFSLTRN